MKSLILLFVLRFTLSMSVSFNIIEEPGIHLWNIHEDEDANPDYERINFSNRPSSNIGTSSGFNSGSSNGSTARPTPILNTRNTYIILKISKRYTFYLYYWIGAQSSEKKRKNVANSIGFMLKNKILTAISKIQLKVFRREAEGAESISFSYLFKLPGNLESCSPSTTPTKRRLYRIAGSKGQFIIEVPLIYSELNGSDSFILDSYKEVYQWDSVYSNELKIQRAKSLKNRIINTRKKLEGYNSHFLRVMEGKLNAQQHFKYNTFKKKFLSNLTDIPKSQEYPQTPANYSDSELADKRRDHLRLYEYFRTSFIYVADEQQIPWVVLRFNILKENNAYVLVDYKCGNITVFLGNNADTEQIKMALSAAERFPKTTGVKDAWQQVKIFRQGKILPIWLQIYFECEAEKI